MDPTFLTLDEVLEIHRDQVERYGGSHGVRDMGLLQSAVAMPTASFGGEFLHRDIFEMAAAYVFHIVRNHAFVDGNKRTGISAGGLFLATNGIRLEVGEERLVAMTLAVAEGGMEKTEIAEFLRGHSREASMNSGSRPEYIEGREAG